MYEDGAKQEITAEQLPDYVTEKGNPRNTKGVREVVISHPSAWLKGGVRILQRIDVTIEGIENAMLKGTTISRANAVEFEQINTALSVKTRKLDEIRGRLVAVMENMGTGIG